MNIEDLKILLTNALNEVNEGTVNGEALGALKKTFDYFEALENGREAVALSKIADGVRIIGNQKQSVNDDDNIDFGEFAQQNRIVKK